MTKKLVAIILALTLSISVLMVPVSAASVAAPQTLEINIENVFNRVLNDLIHYVLTYLNRFWPGFEEEFDSSETYVAEYFYEGEVSFDTSVKPNAKWSLGYSSDSLIDDFNIMNGDFFLADGGDLLSICIEDLNIYNVRIKCGDIVARGGNINSGLTICIKIVRNHLIGVFMITCREGIVTYKILYFEC